MSEFLPLGTQLFHSASVDPENLRWFQRSPLKVAVPAAEIWPSCNLLTAAAGDADWIAYVPGLNQGHLQIIHAELVPQLQLAWQQRRPVIFTVSSSLPEVLEQALQPELLPFVCRPSAWDLVVLPRETARNGGNRRLSDVLLQDRPLLKTLGRRADSRHLPGITAGSPLLDEAILRPAIRQALRDSGTSAETLTCREAGILLLHDFDDTSHTLVQSLEGRGTLQTADYWHGIMHRREPDASNAAWWFRHVRQHPLQAMLGSNLRQWLDQLQVNSEVASHAISVLDQRGAFDPIRLTNLSTTALRDRSGFAAQAAQLVQYWEIVSLLTFEG